MNFLLYENETRQLFLTQLSLEFNLDCEIVYFVQTGLLNHAIFHSVRLSILFPTTGPQLLWEKTL